MGSVSRLGRSAGRRRAVGRSGSDPAGAGFDRHPGLPGCPSCRGPGGLDRTQAQRPSGPGRRGVPDQRDGRWAHGGGPPARRRAHLLLLRRTPSAVPGSHGCSGRYECRFSAPAGPRTTLGLDPGLRTGCKIAVVDSTGKLLTTQTIFPHAPQNHWDKSLRTLEQLCRQHKVELIAIGNGTASRESDKLVAELIKANSELKLNKVMVSEAGASVYSASEFAANEFPNLDVSLRGAVSIARRLQDPLAELVKIEPKSIGVGQYQHDVSQSQLGQTLTSVVEDCVNSVGVDLNMASVPLLTRVSGLNKTLAQNIVSYRDANGSFSKRSELKKVERLGPKAFEQAAGFLRISTGSDPLDNSSVHPEAYPVVKRICEKNSLDVSNSAASS